MKKAVLLFGLIFSLAVVSSAQVRTVTNTTLQKFQQQRLAAEREYRDNYERLGFPSPEELDLQRDADMSARLVLAEQLRQASLEKERIALERRGLELEAARLAAELAVEGPTGYFGGFSGYSSGFDRRGHGRSRRNFTFGGFANRNRLIPLVDRRDAYRVTPFGVIPVPNPRPAIIFRGGPIRGRHR
jgi:hypothetical protein